MADRGEKSQIGAFFFQALWVVVLMLIVPLLIGFGFSGFDTQAVFNIYSLYAAFGIAGLIAVLLAMGVEYYNTKGDEKYGNSVLFASPGENPAFSGFKYFKERRLGLLLLSLFLFSLFGLFLGLQGQSFTGEVLVQQQFTPVGDLLFRLFLVPIAENSMFAGILALTIVLIRIAARRYNWEKSIFVFASAIIIPIVAGIIGVINHQLRYGSSDLSTVVVFLFWTVGGILTLLSGSFVPFVALHAGNNFFYDLQRLFSSDRILIVTSIVIIILGATAAYTLLKKKKQK